MHPDGDFLTASHWGPGLARVRDGRLVSVDAHPEDLAPSAINGNIAGALNGAARVLRPAVRRGWLEHGPGPANGNRGREAFVEIGWDAALDLIAAEISRVRSAHGNRAIYAGSYGWASAGRFHHAQSQLKRFLNTCGGSVRSVGNYSYNAALVLLPHIVMNYNRMIEQTTRWPVIARHTDLVVAFGGLPARATQIADGGLGQHRTPGYLHDCARAGVRFVNLSPLKGDIDAGIGAEWLPPRPGTDVAVMLGLAHTLLAEGLHDQDFLDRYTTGFDRVHAYLTGQADGVAKDAAWAAGLSGLPRDRILSLAREMAAGRTMITCAAGLQRADFGEQPLWMTVTLAAMLGQIGLPGGGFGIGYAVNGTIGSAGRPWRAGALSQLHNPVQENIPVAMVADMLLNPGTEYVYDGQRRSFPDIRMVWWAGGNPFHHAQDLNRLHAAFQRPDTVIVNEIGWTAAARHADIVLPVAAPQERTDFCAGHSDNALIPMPKLCEPPGAAREEFEIFRALEARLHNDRPFSEGMTGAQWLQRLWRETQQQAQAHGEPVPDWEAFLAGGILCLPDPAPDRVLLAEFRADPARNPLATPSGRIELWSATIAGFGLDDCPGQATWQPAREVADGTAAEFPLHLVTGQPATRLHSQYDNGATSRAAKVAGREPVLIHPADAAARGIADGDVVELFNRHGRCLAGAVVADGIRQGCVFLNTGAWWDPDWQAPQARCRHGNPNVLTHDRRTSRLSQGPSAHSNLVEAARFDGKVPAVAVFGPPAFAADPRR